MNFDLNIENYNREELLDIFELPKKFDENMVDIKERKLKKGILSNQEISQEIKKKTLDFIVHAKNIILNNNQFSFEKTEDFYNSNYELKATKLDEDMQDHNIQVRKETSYLSSYPGEFFPGTINPLKKRTTKKNLNIDSRFRENYYTSQSTNYNLILPMDFNNVLQMQLSAIEIPTSYYVVSKQYGNNFFTVQANDLESHIVTIPDGNYDATTIMNAVNNQLSLLPSPYNEIIFAVNLTNGTTGSAKTLVGFSDLTGKTSLTLNFQADKHGIEDHSTPLPLKFGWLLGFRNGIYVNNLNYISEGVLNMKGPNYFFLVVDDYKNNVNNNFFSAFNSSILNKNILARISLQTNLFNVLEQNNLSLVTTPREYFGPVDIQNLNIQLLDEYGRIVDLNNMDFSFCLTFVTSYDL